MWRLYAALRWEWAVITSYSAIMLEVPFTNTGQANKHREYG